MNVDSRCRLAPMMAMNSPRPTETSIPRRAVHALFAEVVGLVDLADADDRCRRDTHRHA